MKAVLVLFAVWVALLIGCSSYTPVKYYFLDLKD